jgi:hypothetical protein
MSLRQLNKLDIIRRVERREIAQVAAAKLLDVTDRTIREYLQRLSSEGPAFLQHGLKGRPSNNALPRKETNRIERLLKTRYPDFGPTFAAEKLLELHGIDRDPKTVRAVQIRLGLWKSRSARTAAEHRFFRERRGAFGEMVQFDGSYHDWFEGRGGIHEACLLLAIDDATGCVTHAQFAPHEGVLPVMGFWLEYARIQGIPKAVYLDRFSTYSMNMKLAKENPDTLTQFERAAKEVGIEVIHAMSPQAKGRVERAFETWQDRLPKELRLQGISTVEEANRFLTRVFIPSFNKKFGREARHPGNLHRKPTHRELTDILPYIFCRQEKRTIQNDFTVPYKTRWFQLLPTARLALRPKELVQVHEFPDGEVHLLVRGKEANFHALANRQTQTKQRAQTLVPTP